MRSRFIQNIVGGGTTACADVVLVPNPGVTPLSVTLSTTTTGAHIFYTVSINGIDPTHTGDNATGTTIRIGSNTGSTGTLSGNKTVRALAYKNGLLDSNITEGDYTSGG